MTSKEIWQKIVKNAENKPTFLPQNKIIMGITIYGDVAPKEQEVEGKFGKRAMYLVKSNFGWLALNKRAFLQLAQIMADADYKTVNVTWDNGVFIRVD